MNWETVLKEIGFVGIIGTLITWLIKQLGQNYLDKNLRSYELELTNRAELYKHELSLISQKASKLHEKRIERIEEIYSLLSNFHRDMGEIISWKVVTGMTPEEIKKQEIETVQKAGESGNLLFDYYLTNKLYFNDETCKYIDEIIKELRYGYSDLTFHYTFGNISPQMQFENVRKATVSIRETVPKIKKELEENFQKILGVE
ncbi:hypothetical protein [Fluviicola taffensis]|uniref:hypothetical protein n=1 Tax=Fluviicola taffensis TaxID=191579 RepID=UPI0031379CDE